VPAPWSIVGHADIHDELRGPFSFWKRVAITDEIGVETFDQDHGWSERFDVTEAEIVGMPRDGIPFWDDIERDLCEHFGLRVVGGPAGSPGAGVPDSGPFENDA